MSEHVTFNPPHLLREYAGKPGFEVEGLALTPAALHALAAETVTGVRELVVIGRWDYPATEDYPARFHLEFGVPTAYIEDNSDYRLEGRRLRLVCPDCGIKDGKHSKLCAA